jgi:hypothetical protein
MARDETAEELLGRLFAQLDRIEELLLKDAVKTDKLIQTLNDYQTRVSGVIEKRNEQRFR